MNDENKLSRKDKIFLTALILSGSLIVVAGTILIVKNKPDVFTRIGNQLSGNLRGAFNLGKAYGRREVFDIFKSINLTDPKIINAIKSGSLEAIFNVVNNMF